MKIPPAKLHKYLKGYLLYSRIQKIKEEFEDVTPPRFLIGEYGYPKVNVGVMTGEEGNHFDLKDYVSKRLLMINNVKRMEIRANNKVSSAVKEAALSIKKVDLEIKAEGVDKRIHNFKLYGIYGPRVSVKNVRVVDNVKTKPIVESIVNDEVKATEAAEILYHKKLDVDYIMQLFTTGNLGIQKKFVPTRWSITAVDDIIGKKLISKVKEYPLINKIGIGIGKLHGNQITIFLIPDVWGFELNEHWEKNTFVGEHFVRDYEEYFGRKDYAENTIGAYYATRLAVAEYLNKIKRQALVIVFREITPEYELPLGVWVVREAVRRAMENVVWFENEKEAESFSGAKLNNSKLYINRKKQRKLNEFI